MESADTHRHSCSICMMISFRPQVIQSCQHTFCKECVDTLFDMTANPKCPMCRGEARRENIRENTELAAEIERVHPEEYAARKRAYEAIDRSPTIFIIHNTATPSANDYTNWKLFVKSVNNDQQKYIERVVVHLHPTFTPSVYALSNKPFELECSGWGVFGIRVVIHWRQKYQRTSDEYTYMLTFHPTETNQMRIVKRFGQNVQAS